MTMIPHRAAMKLSAFVQLIQHSQLAIFIGGACGCLSESSLLNHSGLGLWKLNWKKNLTH